MLLNFRLAALALSLPVGLSSAAFAQEAPAGEAPADQLPADPPSGPHDSFTIGGGAWFVPSYEGSNDYVFIPVAAVRGRLGGFGFSSRGTQLEIDLARDYKSDSSTNFQLGPVIRVNLNRTNRVVDPQVLALGRRKAALELGGYVGLSQTGVFTSNYDTLTIRASYIHDVTGVHSSYLITPSIDYGTPLSKRVYLGASASATFAGAGYANSYFGIDSAGSLRSGLPVFNNPDGGLKNLTFSTIASYSLTGDLRHGLGLYAAGSYSRLKGDFALSPVTSIAGNANQWFGAVGIGYTF